MTNEIAFAALAAAARAEKKIPGAVSAWLEENINPDTGYVLDSSLTVAGAAADAKAAGDSIGELKSALSEIKEISKNMLPIATKTASVNDVASSYDDGVISLSGTATSNGGRTVELTGRFSIPAGTYTFSRSPVGIPFYIESGDTILFSIPTFQNSVTVTLENDVNNCYVGTTVISGEEYDEILSLQLEVGSSASAFVNPSYVSAKDVYARSEITGIKTNVTNNTNKIKLLKRNGFAYVSENGISWYRSNNICYLTISNTIVIRTNLSPSVSISISKETLLSVASASSAVSVNDGVISGNTFAIIYDFTDSELKIILPSNVNVYTNSMILFAHHYSSYTGGELVDSADYYKLEKNIKDTKTASDYVTELNKAVFATVANYFETEAIDCRDKLISECDEKSLVIAFTTDNHYGSDRGANFPNTITTIKAVDKKYPFDFVIDGGDIVQGDAESTSAAINQLASAVSTFLTTDKPSLNLVGNHDSYAFVDGDSSHTPLLDRNDLYAIMQRHSDLISTKSVNGKNYGYIDLENFNIRLIYLDALYNLNGWSDSNWGYTDDELSWFENDALNTNHQVVIFSHLGFSVEFTYPREGSSIKNGANMRTKLETFIANGGVCVGLFHGHTHWDFIGQYSVSNGFKEVSTGCGMVSVGSTLPSYAPEGATMPTRAWNTVTQELWDIIVIKPNSRKVKMIRFGAGNDREFNY